MATAMNTLYRTTGGVVGQAIGGALLAECVSPVVIQTPRGPVPDPLLPNATALNCVFPSALGISLVGVLVTLFVASRAGEIGAYEPVEGAAVAV